MQQEAALLRRLPLSVADAPAAGDEWAGSPLSALSDAALIEAVAVAISRPKRDADSSFLTHAPVELAARAALLPMTAPEARDKARRRIAAIAARYAQEGDEIEDAPREYPDERVALRSLVAAVKEGDGDEVDGALLYLGPRTSVLALRRALAEEIAPMLGAAAHAPILLAESPRIDARLPNAAGLFRAPLRDIAKMSTARLSWQEKTNAAAFDGDAEAELFNRLSSAPRVASSSVYIAPTMLAVEADGYAERLLGDVTASLTLEAASRAVLRTGAYSMLQDESGHAPYGWSHALTMPQAVLANADAAADRTAVIRIAATHALGFRATLGGMLLRDEPPPRPRRLALFDVAPIEAAGAAYHAGESKIGEIRMMLATRASTHGDAHLAKYTLAAFDAAARDRGAARLFLAAAAYLGAWWDAHPDAAFE